MVSGGGRRLRWKQTGSWEGREISERMLPSAHALLCAENVIRSPGTTLAGISGDGTQCLGVTVSAITAALVRSSVIEITGNNRNAIRHARATTTTIRCPRDLEAGLADMLQNRTIPAERTNHAMLSADSN